MAGLSNLLINIWHKVIGLFGLGSKTVVSTAIYSAEHEPPRRKIEKEPLLAFKDGFLVLVVEHKFDDIPSWVEWDQERQIVTVMQTNGRMEEARIEIKEEHYDFLKTARKLLLVSNDNEEQIVHYLPFMPRT
jgi:hypothetical protein